MVVAIASGAVAGSGSLVPAPNADVDRDHIDGDAAPGSPVKETFEVRNHADCSVDLTLGRTLVRGLQLDCPRWTLSAHDAMTCEVTGTRDSEGRLRDRILLTARVNEDCKTGPLEIVAQRERDELQPLLDEQPKLAASAPDSTDLARREKDLVDPIEAALQELVGKDDELRDAAKAEHEMLKQAWKEAQKEQVERIEALVLKLQILPTDNSGMEILDGKIAQARVQGATQVAAAGKERAATCAHVKELQQVKEKALDDLRDGRWHSECSRTAAEIEEEDHVTLEAHLKSAGGSMIPIPPDKLQAKLREKEAKFDAQIATAKESCSKAMSAEDSVKQKWVDAVFALEAQRPEVIRAKQELIATTKHDLEALREGSRVAVMKQRQRDADVDKRRDKQLDELEEQRKQLEKERDQGRKKARADHEKAVDDHARKRRELADKIGNLRIELTVLANNITNAQHKALTLGVAVDFTFHR